MHYVNSRHLLPGIDPEEIFAFSIRKAKGLLYDIGKCPVHRRAIHVSYDYDENGFQAHITRYCCEDFADFVAEKLEEAELFDIIDVK